MKNNITENRPIPKILSLFPKDENFADTREVARGAWISNSAWEKINNIFSLSQNDEAVQVAKEIKEENPGNVEGIFLTENHFAVIEKNVSYQLNKLHTEANIKGPDEKSEPKKIEPPKLPAKVNANKNTETLEKRLMRESPLIRLIALKASEVKKN